MTLDLQPIAPAALLTEIVHEWETRFQQEGAAVRDRRGRRRAGVRRRTSALLKRVFGNLVQNALTHPASADRRSRCRRGAEPATGSSSRSPTTAPGFPREYHEVIFRKFERVKNPNMPRTRSSGLGLAFCKLVVDAHGGRIWVQSAARGRERVPSRAPGASAMRVLPHARSAVARTSTTAPRFARCSSAAGHEIAADAGDGRRRGLQLVRGDGGGRGGPPPGGAPRGAREPGAAHAS